MKNSTAFALVAGFLIGLATMAAALLATRSTLIFGETLEEIVPTTVVEGRFELGRVTVAWADSTDLASVQNILSSRQFARSVAQRWAAIDESLSSWSGRVGFFATRDSEAAELELVFFIPRLLEQHPKDNLAAAEINRRIFGIVEVELQRRLEALKAKDPD